MAEQLRISPIAGEILPSNMLQASLFFGLHDRQSRQYLIETMRAAQAMERAALVDPLTGLLNRNGLEREFQRILKERGRAIAGRGQASTVLALVFGDIDHFKDVNDALGHPAGDQVLRDVADSLTKGSRPGDAVFRFGGEEMGRLSEVPRSNVEAFADSVPRLQKNVRTSIGDRVVTMSMGAIIWDPDKTPLLLSEALGHADELLYQAKEGGRNRARVLTLL